MTDKPMDPTATEAATPSAPANHPRNCWAMDTLVAEVIASGETYRGWEAFEPDETNANLDVVFSKCSPDLASALKLMTQDPRVDFTLQGAEDMEGSVLVSFVGAATSKDSREPFGLAETLAVLRGEEE